MDNKLMQSRKAEVDVVRQSFGRTVWYEPTSVLGEFLKVEIRSVVVLGCPVGNLWDMFVDGEFEARLTYYDNDLAVLVKARKLTIPLAKIEHMIESLYVNVF